jgi:hypothetical protein
MGQVVIATLEGDLGDLLVGVNQFTAGPHNTHLVDVVAQCFVEMSPKKTAEGGGREFRPTRRLHVIDFPRVMLLDIMKDSSEPGKVPVVGYGWHSSRVEGTEATTLRQISQEIQEDSGPPGTGEWHLHEGDEEFGGTLPRRVVLDDQTGA